MKALILDVWSNRRNFWTQCPEVEADSFLTLRLRTRKITCGHSVHKLKQIVFGVVFKNKKDNLWTQCPEVGADSFLTLCLRTKKITCGHSVQKLKAEGFG